MTHTEAADSLAAERYLLDDMAETERAAFEAHFFDCGECADAVRAGALMRSGAAAGLARSTAAGEVHPWPVLDGKVRTRQRSWQWSVAVPWAAAAMLAIALGYQSIGNRPLDRVAPQALTPVTLRPASRGADPVVTLPGENGVVTLAIDVAAPADAQLTYELKTGAGQLAASGRLAAPPSGGPLLLLLPSWTLSPSERYILSVYNGAGTDDYRFVTSATDR